MSIVLVNGREFDTEHIEWQGVRVGVENEASRALEQPSSRLICNARSPDAYVVCTRQRGHDGPHVAHNYLTRHGAVRTNHVISIWGYIPPADPRLAVRPGL